MDDKNLKDRLKNPNKEFDSYFWRPKSRFMRTLLARYIDYVEIAGYLFAAILFGGVIYAWTVTHREYTGFTDAELKPALRELKMPAKGSVRFLVKSGVNVRAADTLAICASAAGTVAVVSPSAGLFYTDKKAQDTSTVPLTADSGAVVGRVLDFTRCSLEATFTGGNIDSVNIGDSAEIKVKRRSGQDITFDIRTPDTTLVARLFSLNPGEYDPFIDSLKSLYTGLEMTAREQGVYTVENAGAPGMIIEFTVRPSSRAGNPLVLNARPFTGVVEKGTRYLGVEVAKPFPDTTMRKLRRWVDAVITAKGLEIDGEPYAVDRINTVLVKLLPLNGSAPLDSYVSYKQRPKKMKQYAQKEFKVTATVRIDTVPPHVERLARSLYEESREYLKVETRVNSYQTSWGKKLVKKR